MDLGQMRARYYMMLEADWWVVNAVHRLEHGGAETTTAIVIGRTGIYTTKVEEIVIVKTHHILTYAGEETVTLLLMVLDVARLTRVGK